MSSDGQPNTISGLVVPLVIWGPEPPVHRITSISWLSDNQTIITGADNGHIILWKCPEDSVAPISLMIGHAKSITAISSASVSATSTRFISAASDGSLCLWDIQDGRCIDTLSTTNIHRTMIPYTYKSSRHTRSTKIICTGDYADFVVLDPQDLSIVFNLSSRVEPDWISSFAIVQRANKPEQCIGVSAAGMIKIWSMTELEKKEMAFPLYEDESKRMDIKDVKAVSFNAMNEKLYLIVTSNGWQVIDLDDLSTVVSYESKTKLIGGQIIDIDKVAIFFCDGALHIFQIPIEFLKGQQVDAFFVNGRKNYLGTDKPFQVAILEACKITPWAWIGDVCFAFTMQKNSDLFQVVRSSKDGGVLIWRIPKYDVEFMQKLTPTTQIPLKYKGTLQESLGCIWEALSDGVPEPLPMLERHTITCSLLISKQGKLLLGRKDGLITITYASDTLAAQLLSSSTDRPSFRKLIGHKGAVRALFYPNEHHSRFDQNTVLSGGDDFAVIAWNINTGARLTTFSVHGGPIINFLVPPPNCSKQMSKCVCAVASDSSVSLLNVKDMKCCLLASRHPHPVKEVRWRPLDDFMLVRLADGSVYVWQMETANIDRIVTGLVADEIMTACDEQIGREEGTDEIAASSAVQLMRALRHKNIDAAKSTVSTPNTSDTLRTAQDSHFALNLSAPLTLLPLPGCSRGAHVIQFEIGSLIGGLLNIDATEGDSADENGAAGLSRKMAWRSEALLYTDIARLMLSLLVGWNLDHDLDAICTKMLSLSKPKHQLYFGNVSRHGQLTVVLPQRNRRSFDSFSMDIRWQASHSLTTTHLLSVISTANTLMNMDNVVPQLRFTRPGVNEPLQRQISKDSIASEKQLVKQGWSLVAALHCGLLPDHVRPKSSYAAPKIELLARRWQDSCVEIRQAAQCLLVRELSRLGTSGRRRLIESWAPFLPPLLDPSLSIFGARLQSSVPTLPPAAPPIPPRQKNLPTPTPVPEPSTTEDGENGIQQVRRNQATAIILLGVVGAEFGDELNRADLTRATALSLLELLIAAPSNLLPVHSPLRRAAIDLLGKGFIYWEPHLEISKVLLGLLDLAANSEKQPMPVLPGYTLTPIADACRTARHALSLIASARPPALLTALSMEVARYNSAAQHQTIQHTVVSPLLKSRTEVLRIIDELSEKRYDDVVERMLSVGEVLVHCLDTSLLKHKTLGDIFPPITKFNMVAYCASSRRIAFGGHNGTCVVHELRAAKSHQLQSHQGPIAAVAFSEDGKYLATYGCSDAKINFWQTSQTFLGMGQTQMKLVKSQPAPSMSATSSSGQPFRPRLVWINPKSLTLMLPEGREQRFTV